MKHYYYFLFLVFSPSSSEPPTPHHSHNCKLLLFYVTVPLTHKRISVCHAHDGTASPGIVINGCSSSRKKIPLSGCQLTYAGKKLITGVS